ncbi:MAG TPA: alpha/beta fold hydrolase [Blastocatellia bacterium]|nr:alpha/beta fold hydrolase [Blastocatellia bacterium]
MMGTSAVAENTKARPRRWRRIFKRVALILLAIAVILIFGVFPYWVARLATNASTRPMDRRLTETPADLGAEFRDVEFLTADGVKISAWLLPSRGKRVTIVYSHGLFRSRRELLDRAIDLWRLGYGALLYDARNHGDSGPATTSLGYHERLDAQAAVRFLREEIRAEDKIVLFGISMGAVTALLAAAETPDVAAVISDTAFLSLEDTLKHHLKTFLRLPAFPLANEIQFFIEQRADFDGEKLSALDAVKRLGDRPVLFITGTNDKRMPPDIARTLHAASQSRKSDLLIVDGPETTIHGHAYQAAPKLYIDRITQFLESAW